MARVIRLRTVTIAIAAVVAVVLAFGTSSGGARTVPSLPSVAPDRLVASTLEALADRTPVSGTIATHVDLGLPQIPGSLGGSTGLWSSLLSDQTFRYWRAPQGSRLAQILPFGERDVVTTRTGAWVWDSDRFAAWHVTLAHPAPSPEPPSVGDMEGLVRRALTAVEPYASISTAPPERVAGRDAYVLTLSPTDATTRVGQIRVAIDAETRVPLRFGIFARGGTQPVVSAGFTSVSFDPVDPSMFDFQPPPGATVHQVSTDGLRPPDGASSEASPAPNVRTFGHGFGTVVAVRVPADAVPAEVRRLLPYSGPLGSVELLDRGDHVWIVGGAVAPAGLASVSSQLP